MKIKLSDISHITNTDIVGNNTDAYISVPLTDSRSLLNPSETLFFALTTSCNDGHRYIRELYRRGVRNFVVSPKIYHSNSLPDDANYIIANENQSVSDILKSTAAYIRTLTQCPVIGITGSCGKTVVKEAIANAFSTVKLTTSPRSWNSQIGVPLSLWRIQPDTQLAIFEAGISRPGEMKTLEKIIRPTIGVFTGLTEEHAHDFVDIEQQCREKADLFLHCNTIIYIDNNPIIASVLSKACPQATIIRVTDYDSIIHHLGNILSLVPINNETTTIASTRIDISDGMEGNTFAFDYYSNNIDGIETALDIVSRRMTPGRSLVTVLGDLQLNGHCPDDIYHRLEKLLIARNVDSIVAVGEQIKKYAISFSPLLHKESVNDVDEFISRFNTSSFPDSTILIKGRPGIGFEAIKTWLEDSRHDTSLEVNLDALVNNFNYYRSLIKPSTGMIAMVKADAYGAGAVEVSRTLQSQGADYLAVAVIEEGLALRRAGISMPIMVLNPITSNYTALFERKLEPTVFSLHELEILSKYVPSDQTSEAYHIHVKLDTGMHRFGLSEDELPQFIKEMKRYPQFKVASVFSHLATADCVNMDDYTIQQLENFERMSGYILSNLDYTVKRHILNTAGIMRFSNYQYDMVRLGIGMYGISPLNDINEKIKPVSRLVTTISALQHRQPGETVGYSRKGVISKPSTIATLPIGYADGLNRHLGNGHISMMVNGVKCQTVGSICMDICMIDVTEASAHCSDKVEIFGEHIPVEDIARTLDTIPYEVLTSISPRVKRIYYRE